ncbi:MAG: hypothetical protein MZU97_01170 [Bacillus subtilis]|nr:hypothetical protein [Bacillus subtilis]
MHRPSYSQFGQPDIWTAESENLIDWGNHKIMRDARDRLRRVRPAFGAGAVPFLTDQGWLEIYHQRGCGDRYHLAAMLLDEERSEQSAHAAARKPLVEPTETV